MRHTTARAGRDPRIHAVAPATTPTATAAIAPARMSGPRAIARPLLGVLTFATVAACGSVARDATAPGPPARNVVAASPSLAFGPSEITIAVGDSVTWAFGGVPHNVVFQHGSAYSEAYRGRSSDRGAPTDVPITTNGSAARVFTNSGSFNYRCTLHPGMYGEVRVQ